MGHNRIKSTLVKIGAYATARHVYRQLNPSARKERILLKRFYRDLISPGDLCFDVGANVWQTTEALVSCGARVICVEPNPMCGPALEWQFGRNPRVTLVKKAIGAETGTAVLNFNGTDSTASIREDWPFENRSAETVEVTTLDGLVAEFGRPKLCKVDVEGFETEVFKGLSQPLPIVYFEIHREEVHRAREVLSRLTSLGTVTAANLIDSDHAAWLFDDWVGIDEFDRRLEEKLPRSANAVLKMAASQ